MTLSLFPAFLSPHLCLPVILHLFLLVTHLLADILSSPPIQHVVVLVLIIQRCQTHLNMGIVQHIFSYRPQRHLVPLQHKREEKVNKKQSNLVYFPSVLVPRSCFIS